MSAARALSEVTPVEVTRRDLLFELQQRDRELVEILRCAVALELPHYERLPRPRVANSAFPGLLEQVARAAPRLAACRVHCVRALCRRGRLLGQSIWVGLPGSEVGPSAEHAAIQAAHEATLAELIETASDEGVPLGERELEHAAVWLLAKRCRSVGFEDPQRRWFRTLVIPEAWRSSRPEDFGLAALPAAPAALALACLRAH